MVIYLVVYTDKWQVDYMPEEAFLSEEKAKKRAEELTSKHGDPDKYFYVVQEMDVVD